MKLRLLSFFAFILFLNISLSTKAVKAYPGVLSYRQPDGTQIQFRMVGDESNHATYSLEGEPLRLDEKGFLVKSYSDPETQRKEKDAKADRRRGPGLMTTYYPTIGEQKALVVLVEFADNEFSMEDPLDFYTRMLNEEGFSDNGATGSARDYFIANSMGQFIPTFDVFGPVKLSEDMEFYGANDRWGDDVHPQLMLIEACRMLDNEIDFTEYDRNGDGVIDNVFVYYAGYGENDGGGANTIWPHSSKLSLMYKEKFIFDGVELDRYACSNELHSPMRDNGVDGIGTFCHEFGHVLGLPDLYATTFINMETPCYWDVMDTGNYNNEGNTPANLSAFERYALDWLEPIPLFDSDATLENLGDSNTAYIFQCNNPNEYFLFENRQQTGFDEYLPGHGMLIWQINYDERIWAQNIVNNSFLQQYVDLIEADGIGGIATSAGDPFPGPTGKTEFSSKSSPAFRARTQAYIPYSLLNIEETEEGLIKFRIYDPTFTDGIETIGDDVDEDSEDNIYDLLGRPVDKRNLPSGIYIHNGCKVLITH